MYVHEHMAVKAIHDFHYASAPDSFLEYQMRLQYLAEMRVGALHRQAVREEDALVDASMEAAADA